MHRRNLLECGAALLGAACVGSFTNTARSARSSQRLFVVARSKNTNIVCYDVRLRPDGRVNTEDPVVAYWTLPAEKNRREGLTFLERKLAYGYRVADVTESGFRLQLSAFERRVLSVECGANQAFRARTRIAGRPAILKRVFVQTDEGGVLPRVRWLEVSGTDLETRAPLVERIDA